MERNRDKVEGSMSGKALSSNSMLSYLSQKTLTFAVVTHVYASGPSFNLESYLVPKVKKLIFIGHPFSFSHDTRSFLRVYQDGKLIVDKKFPVWRGYSFFFYVKDIAVSLLWLFSYGRIDYFIGVDNLNAFTGYILSYFGRVNKIIFYTIDYIPQRFPNKFLNNVYHFLDRLMIEKSSKVWNLSEIMASEREKKGVSKIYRNKQIVVPVGTDIGSLTLSMDKINRYQVAFMGHLRAGHGIELLISAMREVIKKVPKASLLIIGGGPLENELREKVKKLKLEKYIRFSGFVEKISDVQELLRYSAIAVAPYENDAFTQYTDPGKVKDYLSCGLPIIITRVPQVAYYIDKNQCGIAIRFDKKELSDAIVKLLTEEKLLYRYRQNVIKMARQYAWDKIFDKAILESL